MMTIWEKLARCSSPGEIQRMVRGTNFELVERAEIERLRKIKTAAKAILADDEAYRRRMVGKSHSGLTPNLQDLRELLTSVSEQPPEPESTAGAN